LQHKAIVTRRCSWECTSVPSEKI